MLRNSRILFFQIQSVEMAWICHGTWRTSRFRTEDLKVSKLPKERNPTSAPGKAAPGSSRARTN